MAPRSTTIDGIVYLLVQEANRSEYIMRYTGGEMIECFPAHEAEKLINEGVVHRYKKGTAEVAMTIIDMTFAARKLASPNSVY